jgi:delta-lactam-biosynthetic de-N-acetylase
MKFTKVNPFFITGAVVLFVAFLLFIYFTPKFLERSERNFVAETPNNTINNNQSNFPVNAQNTASNTPVANNTPAPQPQPTPTPQPTVPQSYTEIVRGDTTKKQVIFTFDGGSGTQSAEKILDTLLKHKVKGTFFLTGKWVEANPDLTKKIASQGNEIFNHTYSHPDLTTVSDAKIVDELQKTESKIKDLTGNSTKPYFRPPYGARNTHVKNVAKEQGYRSVFWTIDVLDWKETSGQTAVQSKDRILSHVAPGTIYLMHIGDNITGQILDEVFTEISKRGYAIVSLLQGL